MTKENQGLQMEVRLSGYFGGAPVVLLAGWPDTSSVFSSNVEAYFLSTSNHFVISLTLPGYSYHALSSSSSSSSSHSFDARAVPNVRQTKFDDLCAAFHRAIEQAMTSHTFYHHKKPVPKPILVAHDWGCVIASEFLQRYPFYFDRIVFLDIGGHVLGDTASRRSKWNLAGLLLGSHTASPTSKTLWMAFYQCAIMLLYLARCLPFVSYFLRPIADWLAARVTWVLGPRPTYKEVTTGRVVQPRADMGWIYCVLWKGLLMRLPLLTIRFPLPVHVPILYLYGANKKFQFHTDQWLRIVDEQKAKDGISKSVGLPGGHWFFCEPSSQSRTVELIKEFVTAEVSASKASV